MNDIIHVVKKLGEVCIGIRDTADIDVLEFLSLFYNELYPSDILAEEIKSCLLDSVCLIEKEKILSMDTANSIFSVMAKNDFVKKKVLIYSIVQKLQTEVFRGTVNERELKILIRDIWDCSQLKLWSSLSKDFEEVRFILEINLELFEDGCTDNVIDLSEVDVTKIESFIEQVKEILFRDVRGGSDSVKNND